MLGEAVIRQDSSWDDAILETEADSFSIPTHCRTFRSASFNTKKRGDPYIFKSTSSAALRTNQTRSTAFIRFESTSPRDRDLKESTFGEVLFFFTVELLDARDVAYPYPQFDLTIRCQISEKERGPIRDKRKTEILLAFIRQFPVHRDGRLLYHSKKGVLRVILASDIHELVGLLGKGKRDYIVRKGFALF